MGQRASSSPALSGRLWNLCRCWPLARVSSNDAAATLYQPGIPARRPPGAEEQVLIRPLLSLYLSLLLSRARRSSPLSLWRAHWGEIRGKLLPAISLYICGFWFLREVCSWLILMPRRRGYISARFERSPREIFGVRGVERDRRGWLERRNWGNNIHGYANNFWRWCGVLCRLCVCVLWGWLNRDGSLKKVLALI